jgi:hypothetical protein
MTKKKSKKPKKLNKMEKLEAANAKLRKENLVLRKALADACDWALDSADVIDDENLVDPEDGESEDFRARIANWRKLARRPEAQRHIERRKAREATCEGLTQGLIVRPCELPRGHTGEHGLSGGDGMYP